MTVNMTSSSSTFATKASHTCPTTCPRNHTAVGVISVSAFSLSPTHAEHERHLRSWSTTFLCPPTHALWSTTCQAWNHTIRGVISCLVSFLCPPTHAKHEWHPCWCRFVVGLFLCPPHTPSCRAQNHTKGVILCSASFLRPTTHADHETTCCHHISHHTTFILFIISLSD